MFLIVYRAVLKMKIFLEKFVKKIKTHISYSITFFLKFFHL
jgi:hypothetical protein